MALLRYVRHRTTVVVVLVLVLVVVLLAGHPGCRRFADGAGGD